MFHGLLVPQRVDRIKACRAPGGEVAECYAHQRRERKCEEYNWQIGDEWYLQCFRCNPGEAETKNYAHQAAQQRKHNRFGQELHQDLSFERANGQADPDLTRAFRH